jgi:hypothetical protein
VRSELALAMREAHDEGASLHVIVEAVGLSHPRVPARRTDSKMRKSH